MAKVRSEQRPLVAPTSLFGAPRYPGTQVLRYRGSLEPVEGAVQTEQLIWEPALEPRQLGRHQRLLLELNV